MVKYLIVAIVVIAFAVVFMGAVNTVQTRSNNSVAMSIQQTEQIRAIEQTKQEAAQLRTEESSRVLNTLAMIIAPILVIGVVTLLLIVADSKITRNRVYEIERLAIIARNQLREQQRLEMIEQRRILIENQTMLQLPRYSNQSADVISATHDTWYLPESNTIEGE